MFEIISTVICVLGCTANLTSLSYLLLRQRKGLTNKLFALLTFWDFTSCVLVTMRIWDSKHKLLKSIYIAAIYNNCNATLLIATTRAIKICMPFYRIRKKAVWSFSAFVFLYSATIGLAMSYKGEILYHGIFTVDYWQIAFLSTDLIWMVGFVSAIVVSNILSARKLLRPGPIPVSSSNAEAAKTVIIISAIFLVSNSIMVLHFSRNIKYVIQRSNVQLIKNWNVELGKFVFRMQLLLNSLCNPVVYFIRNRNIRNWVSGGIPNSLKLPKFVQISQILTKSGVEPTSAK